MRKQELYFYNFDEKLPDFDTPIIIHHKGTGNYFKVTRIDKYGIKEKKKYCLMIKENLLNGNYISYEEKQRMLRYEREISYREAYHKDVYLVSYNNKYDIGPWKYDRLKNYEWCNIEIDYLYGDEIFDNWKEYKFH